MYIILLIHFFLLVSVKGVEKGIVFSGGFSAVSFEESAGMPIGGRTMQDSGILAVLVCIPGTAVRPLTPGGELIKLIYAWVCRNFLLLSSSNSFVIY